MKRKRLCIAVPAAVLTVALVAGSLIVPSMTAKAESYNETNPEFLEAKLNGDAEVILGVKGYVQETEFKQDTNEGKYEITTNAYVAWTTEDDIALLYRQYNVGTTMEDHLIVEVTVDSQEGTTAAGIHANASSGLMIRGSVTDPSAPSIYLHTRSSDVAVVYRTAKGENTLYTTQSVAPVYPVTLRIEKTGKKYACSYKNGDSEVFVPLTTIGSAMSGPVYAGVASHSCNMSAPIHSVYSNYSAIGSGTLAGGTEEPGGNKEPEKLEWEDAPFDKDTTLLYETFSDGSMTEGEETINNPVWSNELGSIVMNEEKTNRSLYLSYDNGYTFAGSQTKWTDYSVSMDYELCPGIDTAGNERLVLWTRHKRIDTTGYYGVGFAIETAETTDSSGHKVTEQYLNVYHRQRSTLKAIGTKVAGTKIADMIGTGGHQLRVDCLDNTFTAYIDGEEILRYTDDSTSPNLRGCIGIEGQDVEAYIDNIIVTKLEDPNGGDYDNYIGSNYGDDIPEYVKEYLEKNP